MLEADVNVWAVLVAAVVSMVIGAGWYNAFSKPWLAGVGLTEKDVKGGSATPYIISFLCMILIGYVMAHIIYYVDAVDWADGLMTGLWVWLGFAATVTAINYAYQMKSIKLYAIDAGYTLVFFGVTGAILGAWQ